MTVTTLLMLWALPIVHDGQSGSAWCANARVEVAQAQACVLHSATDSRLPIDPFRGGPGISAAEEEERLEDGCSGNGLLIASTFGDAGPGAFLDVARVRHNLSRQSHHPHPLRC